MALNWPGPYEVRIRYSVNGFEHVLRLNCSVASAPAPGTPWANIDVNVKSGVAVPLADAVDDYVDAIRPFLSTADTSFIGSELWQYAFESFETVFISSGAIAGGGTSGASHVPASQQILTVRTAEGGIIKATVMQGTTQPGAAIAASAFTANLTAWANQFTGVDSAWLGRDTSYGTSALKFLPGQNEALFKRIYR